MAGQKFVHTHLYNLHLLRMENNADKIIHPSLSVEHGQRD